MHNFCPTPLVNSDFHAQFLHKNFIAMRYLYYSHSAPRKDRTRMSNFCGGLLSLGHRQNFFRWGHTVKTPPSSPPPPPPPPPLLLQRVLFHFSFVFFFPFPLGWGVWGPYLLDYANRKDPDPFQLFNFQDPDSLANYFLSSLK